VYCRSNLFAASATTAPPEAARLVDLIALCSYSVVAQQTTPRPAAFPPFRPPSPDNDEADSVCSARKIVRFVHPNTRAQLPRGVQINARRSHLTQMDKDSVRCGAAPVPGSTRFGVPARASIATGKETSGLWSSAGAEERQRRERVWWRGAHRGVGAARVRRHSSPAPTPAPTGRRTSRPARGGARGCRSTRAPPPPPLSMREREGAEETVGAWCLVATRSRQGTHGRASNRGRGGERSRPMPTLGPGPTHASNGSFAPAARLTCRAVPSSRLAVPLGVLLFFITIVQVQPSSARRQPLYVVTTGG